MPKLPFYEPEVVQALWVSGPVAMTGVEVSTIIAALLTRPYQTAVLPQATARQGFADEYECHEASIQ